MATEVGRIVARYIADTTSFERGNARVRAEMGATAKTANRGKASWASYGKYGVLAAGAAAIESLKSFANFDRNMNIFQANTDASTRTMHAAREEAKKLGADARFPAVTAADVANSFVELSKAGLTAKQSMKAVEPVMLLGTAGQMDFADAGTIAANAMNAFHLKASAIPGLVDDIAGAALKSSADVEDVAEAFRYTSSAAAGLGVGIKDTTSLIGLLSNLGLKGAMAGTSMRMFFNSIATPRSNPAADLLASMGILTGGKGPHHKGGKNLFFDEKGNIKSITAIFKIWKKHSEGMTRQQKIAAEHTIFGVRGMNVARAMDRFGPAGFAKMRKESTKAGLANKLAAANTKGLYGAYQNLINVVQTLGLELGEYLAPYAVKVLNVFSKYASMLEKNQHLVKQIAKAIVIVIGAYVAWRGILVAWKITQLITNAITLASRAAMVLYRVAVVAIRAPMQLAKIAQMELNAALLANPIGIIIVAIIAIILILRHFGVSLDDVRHAAVVAWDKIKGAFFGAYNWVKGFFAKNWKKVLLAAIVGPFAVPILLIAAKWGAIKGAFSSALAWVKGVFHAQWKNALLLLLGGPFWGPLILLVKHYWGAIKSVLHSILGFIAGLAATAYNAAVHLGGRIKDGVIDGLKGLPGEIKDSILGSIPGGHAAGKAGGWIRKHLAAGGTAYGGSSYLVGENGPEIFTPRGTGYVTPNHKMGHGGGGPSVNIEHMSVRSEEDPYVIASVLSKRMQFAQ